MTTHTTILTGHERPAVNPHGQCALLFPVDYRNALQAASRVGSIAAIDRLTDDLVRMGLCRKRSDEGQFQFVAGKGASA